MQKRSSNCKISTVDTFYNDWLNTYCGLITSIVFSTQVRTLITWQIRSFYEGWGNMLGELVGQWNNQIFIIKIIFMSSVMCPTCTMHLFFFLSHARFWHLCAGETPLHEWLHLCKLIFIVCILYLHHSITCFIK